MYKRQLSLSLSLSLSHSLRPPTPEHTKHRRAPARGRDTERLAGAAPSDTHWNPLAPRARQCCIVRTTLLHARPSFARQRHPLTNHWLGECLDWAGHGVPKSAFKFFTVEFIKECLGLQQPVESEVERTSKAAERAECERRNASVSQVVRKSDRSGKRVCFSKGLPSTRTGKYTCGDDGKSHKNIKWETDTHKLMVCDMLGLLNKVVDDRFGGNSGYGNAQLEDKLLFKRLVEEERGRDKTKYTRARSPFRPRAGLRLIMMLTSILP